jgi:hypothetical protein
VRARQETGQDAGMRRVGDRAGCESVGKPHAVFGQSVQRRCGSVRVPIAVNVVGTQGIDGDQKDVWGGRL